MQIRRHSIKYYCLLYWWKLLIDPFLGSSCYQGQCCCSSCSSRWWGDFTTLQRGFELSMSSSIWKKKKYMFLWCLLSLILTKMPKIRHNNFWHCVSIPCYEHIIIIIIWFFRFPSIWFFIKDQNLIERLFAIRTSYK